MTLKTGVMMLKIQLCIARINYILNVFNFFYNILENYCFYCIFNQINAALVSIRDLCEQQNGRKDNCTFKLH